MSDGLGPVLARRRHRLAVVMSYVFFGGMRGTAWVNTFQTMLFLLFGAIAVVVIGAGMGGFRAAMESMLASPSTAPLLTRERISPLYFFSYTFIPLSSIAFPHIGIFCLTARNARTLPEDDRALSDLHAGDLAAVGVSRRRRQPGDGRAGDRRQARGARAARRRPGRR